MLQFQRTGDADYPRHLNIALMGPPKSGKTTFLSTAPNIVIAAAEAGLMSIAHKNVPFVKVEGSETIQQLIMVLGSDSLRQKLAESLGMEKIETFALDTLDAFQEILKKERLRSEKRTQLQRDDWGWLKDTMSEMIKALVACPVNVVLTVHTKTTQDDESRIITMPGLQGAIAEELAGLVDFSILSQRSPEIMPDGTPYTKYSLKVEGDNKNPHLGNRAAGRLPGEVEPDFQLLHDAVFKGITTTPTASPVITVPAAEVAQPAGQPAEGAEAAAAPAAPTVTAPPSDDDQPVNATALQVLTKFFEEFGWKIDTEAVGKWKLGDARLVARMFKAHKEDVAAGNSTQEAANAEMLTLVTDMGAPPLVDAPKPAKKAAAKKAVAVVPDPAPDPAPAAEPVSPVATPAADVGTPVQTDVDTQTTPAEAPAEPVAAPAEALPSEAPAAEATTLAPEGAAATEPATPTDQEALKTLETQVGAQVIAVEHAPGSPCEVCGNAVDDEDIAHLGQTRFGAWLCVTDYIARTKQSA